MLPRLKEALSFEDLNNELKNLLHNIFTQFNTTSIHRAKLSIICKDLANFQKFMSRYPNSDETPNERQTKLYQRVFVELSAILQVFSELTEENYLQSIMRQPLDYYKQRIMEFADQINQIVPELFPYQGQVICIDNSQFELSDKADLQKIMLKIQNEPETLLLLGKIREISSLIHTKYIQHETLQYISDNEITMALKKYSDKAIKPIPVLNMSLLSDAGDSKIYSVFYNDHQLIAKVVNEPYMTKEQFERYFAMIKTMAEIDYPLFANLYGFTIKPPYSIYTDRISGSSLFTRLHSPTSNPNPTSLTIAAYKIAQGMVYLHSKNLLHTDLSTQNILLNPDDLPMVIFFSKNVFERWRAPEGGYSKKTDVYDYGVILWEILTLSIPYENLAKLIPINCPRKLANLILSCLDEDPNSRPDFESIVKQFEKGIAFPGTDYIKLGYFLRPDSKSSLPVSSNSIIQQIEDCSNHQAAAEIFKRIDEILKSGKTINGNICENLMDLFMRFGTTANEEFIRSFDILFRSDQHNSRITEEGFQKLSTFLLVPNSKLRLDTVSLLGYLIETKSYEKEKSLTCLVPNLLTNISEPNPALYLKLLIKLASMGPAAGMMNRVDAMIALFDLYMHDDDETATMAIQLCKILIMGSKPSYKVSSEFVGRFGQFVTLKDSRVAEILYLAEEMNNSGCFNEHSNLLVPSIGSLLKKSSNHVLLITLTVSTQFLKKFECFTSLTPDIVNLLQSEKQISEKAAICIAQCVSHKMNDLSAFLVDDVVNYLNSDICEGSLRLAGVLSCIPQGAEFVSKTKIIDQANHHLHWGDPLLSFCLKLLCSLSSTLLNHNPLKASIPKIYDHIKDDDISPYVYIFAQNITYTRMGADMTVNHLIKFLDEVDGKNSDKAMSVIFNVLSYSTPEKLEKQILSDVLAKIAPLMQKSSYSLDIIYALSSIEGFKVFGGKSHISDVIRTMLHHTPVGSIERPKLLRIVSRLD